MALFWAWSWFGGLEVGGICWILYTREVKDEDQQALVIFGAIYIQTMLLNVCPVLRQIVQFGWSNSTE